MEVTKLDANTISVSKEEVKTTATTYDYDFLVKQRESIQAQKAQQIADRDRELAEIEMLLGECDRLEVVAKPIEIIKEVDELVVVEAITK